MNILLYEESRDKANEYSCSNYNPKTSLNCFPLQMTFRGFSSVYFMNRTSKI